MAERKYGWRSWGSIGVRSSGFHHRRCVARAPRPPRGPVSQITSAATGRSRSSPPPPAGRAHGEEDDEAGIAVLTSGGDAPGMNAAIRAVVRTGSARAGRVRSPARLSGLIVGTCVPSGPRRGRHHSARRHRPRQRAAAPSSTTTSAAAGARSAYRRWALTAWWSSAATAPSPAPTPFRARISRRRCGLDIDNDLAAPTHHRRRHRAQHRARGDRPAPFHRLVAPARVPRRGDGPRLRLPGLRQHGSSNDYLSCPAEAASRGTHGKSVARALQHSWAGGLNPMDTRVVLGNDAGNLVESPALQATAARGYRPEPFPVPGSASSAGA